MKQRLLAGVILAILAITGLPPGIAAAGADLRLRPDEGGAGETIMVRGRDFPPGKDGVIEWEGVDEPVGAFTTDDSGDFEVAVTVPDLPAGEYLVRATAGDQSADDRFEIEAGDEVPLPSGPVATPQAVNPAEIESACLGEAAREIEVTTAAELTAALADARAGDRIRMADGTYPGNFVAEVDGVAEQRIALCGSRAAVIDGGGWQESGYALHLTGDFWSIEGITVTNAQEGVMADGVNFVILNGIEVHTTGHEAVHFRTHSSDNIIATAISTTPGWTTRSSAKACTSGPPYRTGRSTRTASRTRASGTRYWRIASGTPLLRASMSRKAPKAA
jgi:hypothetical protein